MDRYDKDLVKQYANGKWADILARAFGVDADSLDGKHHPCPQCGGTDRFRFTDQGGDGSALCNKCGKWGDGFSFGEFLSGEKFGPVLARVAAHLGIEKLNGKSGSHGGNGHGSGGKSTKGKSSDPAEHLTFQSWNEGNTLLARYWCLSKPPITFDAILICGGLPAIYSYYDSRIKVIAFPVHGEKFADAAAPPVGWCIYNITGHTLPGPKKTQVKTKLTYGSNQPGFIGPVHLLTSATEIWKLEGPTDLLAFYSLPDRPASAVAVTNKAGAGESPAPWQLALFAGRLGRTLGDADKPGEAGAIVWAGAIATAAAESRRPTLPYSIQDTHGKDLRDFLNESSEQSGEQSNEPRPRTFADVAALAADAPLAEPLAPAALAATLISSSYNSNSAPLESDDDPHRLARVNLERYASSRNGATLRFWRDEWYVWKRDRYRRIPIGELKAKITGSIRREFESLWQQAMAEYESNAGDSDDDGPPRIRKVTRNLLTDVINATAGMVIISSGVDEMTWIGSDGTRERRNYVSLKNGILDMDAVLADSDDVLLPHTPEWFSTISLPYDFNPEAKCPKWEAFLNKMMDGDETFIKLLQEWAGYMLLPDTGEQKFLANEGEGGNGKSVFCAAISAMVGTENCSFVPLEEFGDRFSKSSTIGKLVNICADVGELDRVAEGYLKSFTSGDAMYFDRKGIAPLQCVPTARMIVNWNNRPKLADRSGGIWRRIVLVPWDVEVAESDKIKNMDKAAWWERSGELPGMLNWALVGLGRLRQQGGFTPSDRSKGLVDDYRTDANPTRRFLLECIEESKQGGTRGGELGLYCKEFYRFYVWWMKENGHHCFPSEVFGKEIRKVFKKIERVKDYHSAGDPWFYRGIIFQSEKVLGEDTRSCICFKKDATGF